MDGVPKETGRISWLLPRLVWLQIGFGNRRGEYWLGLDKIHRLTKLVNNTLRVELEDTECKTAYAAYDMFAVSSEKTNYQLSLGTYSGM